MITNFEEITKELSQEEKMLLDRIITLFNRHTEKNPIKEGDIVREIKKTCETKNKFTGSRLRKLVNYIRRNSLIPLIATNKGYFVSYNQEIIKSQIKSMHERSGAITKAATGLKKFLHD